ncbi:MAG: nitrogen regulation protein NR(II) [Rhodocyclaceae bacterium]|nr:nitrogen regulation protein NR(II) [Rhodocyclaceae bacterium]
MEHPLPAFAGLDLLATAVMVLDERFHIQYMNPAAENLFAASAKSWTGKPIAALLGMPSPLAAALENALVKRWSYAGHDIAFGCGPERTLRHLDCTVTPIEMKPARLLLEFRPVDRQLKTTREEREAIELRAHQEVVRSLAHEIKNPLGGIRGAAQLLDAELSSQETTRALREYTAVIIEEADRLQALLSRLLSSHRQLTPAPVNIHAVLDRVARLVQAEFPGIAIRRDYDPSLPELLGDGEQLIQALLNIARNAAEALAGKGEIIFSTRISRQVTLAKRRYPLAIEVRIIDHGPGIPDEIRDRLFYPLVSGRPSGTGLGLALAQTIVLQHHGAIEVDSRRGYTAFSVRLPIAHEKGTS